MFVSQIKKEFLVFLCAIFLLGCQDQESHTIKFATSAEYPPFEYYENSQLMGFDIELARMLAQEIKKEAQFQDMQFGSILASLQTGRVDAAIATITATEERRKNFDFSDVYYTESLSLLYPKNAPLSKENLAQKRIGCQLGTTMELWLKLHARDSEIVLVDSNNQAVESLKAGHVDVVLIDTTQALKFSQTNPSLDHTLVGQSEGGYAIAFPKGSKFKDPINIALKKLNETGALDALRKKWLRTSQ